MIDAEVQRIINDSHEEAKRLLTQYRPQLDALADALMARETLDEREILEVTGLPPAPQLETRMLPVNGHGVAAPRERGDGEPAATHRATEPLDPNEKIRH